MSLGLLDSGIIIDVLNGKRGRLELTQQLLRQGAILASCPTTITEVYAGLRPEEAVKTERLLRSLKFFPLPSAMNPSDVECPFHGSCGCCAVDPGTLPPVTGRPAAKATAV